MTIRLVALNKSSNDLPACSFILLTLDNFDLGHEIKFGGGLKRLTKYIFFAEWICKLIFCMVLKWNVRQNVKMLK